ncbi:energy-coupled thiamine transporter ThiT [Clostridium perfringens]|uniref:energy-coupled thiamine transporter ThiT n=1 Tax=Clostridium perfringens TaxID=1502 RepID=UPI001EBB0C20|nr:energy-coupled thiamine transporter ThiT [Clostridium perfringens]EHK2305131.1 energy-coupled thiamine transporter ThiT [Clostridium perfringens]EIL8446415.1 energy-coupled thiamine transporter ThiT [Clostridium perfringens]ELC8379952.1 energy-coupled thiamine transporter ThiT [Clostridium perfringens]MDU7548099.1 energy-coupled thiamine transporter ThiT [Clostridium perfringens]MDZ5035694.1 energy-coupled thiamine transporter ThiT [Clostridium perfringens]
MMSFSQIINDFIQSFSSINLGGNFKEIVTNPLTILTLIGVLIILVLLIKAKDIKFDAKMLTTIGIALALTAVLNMLKIYKFPQGGGITLGSMIPIILIAYAYGPLVGMLTGFLFGIISLFIDPYILHPVQVLFDYPIPYMALGVAGFFKNHRISGAVVAIFLKFLAHFISGVVFFGSFAPEGMSPILYSFLVNGSLIGADGLICVVLLGILPVNRLIKAISSKSITSKYAS